MRTIWVLGATGQGGRAIAGELLAGGADVVLVGRDHRRLTTVAESLGGPVRTGAEIIPIENLGGTTHYLVSPRGITPADSARRS